MQIGTILVIIGYILIGGGSLIVYYGNKLSQQSFEQRIVRAQQTISKQQEIIHADELKILEQQKATRDDIAYLRKVILKGDKELVKQTDEQFAKQAEGQIIKQDRLDFRIGTIVFHVPKRDLFNNKELNLLIISEDQKASIRFNKDKNDYVRFIYEFPGIGKLEKGYQVTQADVQKHDTTLSGEKRKLESVFFAFAWNLQDKKITLWVNAIEIK